jgi:hypothetical protein
MTLYIYTIDDRLPSKFPFEYIFNGTNINELHLYGSLIVPDPASTRHSFKGLVQSLTLHRHIDTVDSQTFPFYSSVFSYTIHSTDAHVIDFDSFASSYPNLRGLELINPRFEVYIDRVIDSLDSMVLDVEHLHNWALTGARHLRRLKLGSRLRRIDSETFVSISQRLHHLDLSEVALSELPLVARCHLVHFVFTHRHQDMTVVYPFATPGAECLCAQLFLDSLQAQQWNNQSKENENLCPDQCRFSECPTISEYFKNKYRLLETDHEQRSGLLSNKINSHLIDDYDMSNDLSPHLILFPDLIYDSITTSATTLSATTTGSTSRK